MLNIRTTTLVLSLFFYCSMSFSQDPDCGGEGECSLEEIDFAKFANPPIDPNNPNYGDNFCDEGAIHNAVWFPFVAGSTAMEISVTSSMCNFINPPCSTAGIQVAIWSDCSGTCIAGDETCIDTATTVILNVTDLEIGEVYYVIIDGCCGTQCDMIELDATPVGGPWVFDLPECNDLELKASKLDPFCESDIPEGVFCTESKVVIQADGAHPSGNNLDNDLGVQWKWSVSGPAEVEWSEALTGESGIGSPIEYGDLTPGEQGGGNKIIVTFSEAGLYTFCVEDFANYCDQVSGCDGSKCIEVELVSLPSQDFGIIELCPSDTIGGFDISPKTYTDPQSGLEFEWSGDPISPDNIDQDGFARVYLEDDCECELEQFVQLIYLDSTESSCGQSEVTPCAFCHEAGTLSDCHLCGPDGSTFTTTTLPCEPPCATQPDQPDPLCFGIGSPQNVSWFSFVPSSSDVVITILAENCIDGCGGVQSGLYDACDSNCITGQESCGPEAFDYTYEITDLNVGQVYFLFLDGCCGSSCEVKITIDGLSGELAYYRDADGDGFGDPNDSVLACKPPEGYVNLDTDCDDTNPEINPDATEQCNGVDDNCDGEIETEIFDAVIVNCCDSTENSILFCWDEIMEAVVYEVYINGVAVGTQAELEFLMSNISAGEEVVITVVPISKDGCSGPPSNLSCTATSVTDADMDGVDSDEDCDDNDPNNFPGNVEECDGQDNDCDGDIDEGFTFFTLYLDADGDGFGDPNEGVTDCEFPNGFVADNTDCDDTNPEINPDAAEIPGNGIDEDCDGLDGPSSIYTLDGISINIYPNPVDDILNVSTSGLLDYSVQLFDYTGKNLVSSINKSTIDLTNVASGVYILKIQNLDSEEFITEKIIVSH